MWVVDDLGPCRGCSLPTSCSHIPRPSLACSRNQQEWIDKAEAIENISRAAALEGGKSAQPRKKTKAVADAEEDEEEEEEEGEYGDEDGDMLAGMPRLPKLSRWDKLINVIQENRNRPDVVQWAPPPTRRAHFGTWEIPPSAPVYWEQYPDLSMSDTRALAEKRQRKAFLDVEWKRRQALVGAG